MEENRFFRIVWRVNAIAIMLLVIAGVLAVLVAGYGFINQWCNARKPPIIKNIAEDPLNKEKWRLGNTREIIGTSYIYIALESENKNVEAGNTILGTGMHSYGKSEYFNPSRNIMFINTKNMDMKWLFKGNAQLITGISLLGEFKYKDKDRKVKAIVYQIVAKDTNSNKILDREDMSEIAISDVDGNKFKVVVPSVDRVINSYLIDDDNAVIIYQANSVGYVMNINLETFTASKAVEMPKISPSP